MMAGWNKVSHMYKQFPLYRRAIKLWHRVISIGIVEGLSDWDKKRIRLLNGISTMAFLSIVVYCLSYLSPAYRLTFWESFQGLVAYAIVIFLNSKHKYNTACHFFSIYNMVSYTFQAISHGAVDGAEYILLSSSMASMLIFKDLRVIIIYFLLNGLCFALCKYSFTVMKPFLFMANGDNLYVSNHVLMFIIVFLIVYYFKSENSRQERLLADENITLLNEKQHILATQNEMLEHQVAERTMALSKSLADLKTTQQQLIQSEKLASLGELTAGIAHEIQNPLNFVNNFSEVSIELLEEMDEEIGLGNFGDVTAISINVAENLKKIRQHGMRADAIVKGMLQHSRKNTGQKEPADINILADEYLKLAYHGLRAKDKSFNAALETDFDGTVGKIEMVPQEMGRVLLNLYNNAFYAVAEKKRMGLPGFEPHVLVSTKQLGTEIEIRVKDNGMGIPQEVLDKIFQPFFTTKPSGQGTGLGLSLSYDIVTKMHNGTLKVNTVAGGFTEFVITIPENINI